MPQTHTLRLILFYRLWACPGPIEPTVIAATCPYYITMSYHTLTLLDTVPYLEEDGSNWPTFAPHFREAMKATYWGYSNGTTTHPIPNNAANPTNAEIQAIKGWERDDTIAQALLSMRLPDWVVLSIYPTAKTQWDWLIRKFSSQPGYEGTSTEEELTRETPVVTGQGGS